MSFAPSRCKLQELFKSRLFLLRKIREKKEFWFAFAAITRKKTHQVHKNYKLSKQRVWHTMHQKDAFFLSVTENFLVLLSASEYTFPSSSKSILSCCHLLFADILLT